MDSITLRRLFGRRVRSLRRLRDLTQEDLADRTGLSAEYISRIERGLASPSFESIASIAKVLSVEPYSLFDFKQLGTDSADADKE
ncbi:helix-turn-helix domain-containing protein [Chloroflexus sp.]|uniref:helix-turn-helix domain-containing protein n=1 Tax=Chloroflexus sp. TaxID=1904827 RepID=UPI003A102BB8